METRVKPPKRPVKIGPGFAFSNLERALHECLSQRDFGAPQMEQVIEFFGGHPSICVYCGAESPRRWDHLVPVRSGGETVLGNMVPACARCDDSKQDLPVEEWWESGRRYSPASGKAEERAARLAKLRAYVAHFNYRPRKLEDRLSPEERARLERIRETARDLRTEFDDLVRVYGHRVRSERPIECVKPQNPGHQADV